jgi:hypothetical protein
MLIPFRSSRPPRPALFDMLFVVAAVIGFSFTSARAAEPSIAGDERIVRLNPPQMFRLADQLLARGSTAQATQILELLARNPDSDVHNEARFRRSKLLEEEGKTTGAALLLRAILDERPDAVPARLALAQLLDRMGDKDAAWREMRAVRASGLPAAVARMVDRYSEALRASRPHGASLEIALAPDSNINRATRSDTLGTIFGNFDIDQQSKARSGTGLSLRGQAYRRFALAEAETNLLVRLSGFGDLYRKMRFNDIAVDLAAGPELRLGRNQVNVELGATRRWFGQKPFMRSVRAGATWTRPLGNLMQLRLSGSAALIDNQLNDLQDGKSYAGRVEIERAFSATTGVGLNLSLNRDALKDPGYATTGWRAGLIGWREIGRMTLTAQADVGRLHADERLLLFPNRREDRYSRFGLGATFRQLQFRGFAPVARFSIERNRSTVEFYDYRRTRSEIGVVRAF